MQYDSLIQYLTHTFTSVDLLVAMGYTFVFYNPDTTLPPDHRFPFITIATEDSEHDRVSDLNRPGVFRLNIGVGNETFRSLLGVYPSAGVADAGHDFTALDRIMPHPVYAPQAWICVLSPSDATFEATVRPLLAEAYAMAVKRYSKGRPAEQR